MRKILLFLAAIMVTLPMGAQKILEGTKPSLKGVNKINLKIDFSETKIDNKSIADWLEYRQASQPKYDAKINCQRKGHLLLLTAMQNIHCWLNL